MIAAIMQPYFIPYLGYFQLINLSDSFYLYDDVSYIKKGWVNRNAILLNSGRHELTLPLQKASQNKYINELNLSDSQFNFRKIEQLIYHAYKKAPCFNAVFPMIQLMLNTRNESLSDFLANTISTICNYLQIFTPITRTSALEYDRRRSGAERILEICDVVGATTYVNPDGGFGLYDRQKFAKASLELKFHKVGSVTYQQFQKEFEPMLSIVDVLMFNEVEAIVELLKNYELLDNLAPVMLENSI